MAASPAEPPSRDLAGCPDCGLLQHLPSHVAAPNAVAACRRCGAMLRRWRREPLLGPLAFALAALAFNLAAVALPLIRVDIRAQVRETNLASLPFGFAEQGFWLLAAFTFAIAVALPLCRMLGLLGVLAGLHLRRPPRILPRLLRWIHVMQPWAMAEVFAIGLAIAYSKLGALARVEPEAGAFALGALLLAGAAADAAVDRAALWKAMDRRGLAAAPPPPAGPHMLACEDCGLVSRSIAGAHCPRCGTVLEARKPGSRVRTVALLLTALILYVPANALPAMTVTYLGSGEPNTILGGVRELLEGGQWPLAAIVFAASVMLPVLKLLSLGAMLLATRRDRRPVLPLRSLTRIYRLIDTIGRWSMIDLFVLASLVALVQAGALAQIVPGAGAMAFAAVVVLTMLATESFDPRLMWDAAEPEGGR